MLVANDTIHLVVEASGFGIFILGYLDYRSRNKKEVERQVEMHAENKHRLETLADFHEEQKVRNGKLDEQISQLALQSARVIQLAEGQERRLRMLEDRQ